MIGTNSCSTGSGFSSCDARFKVLANETVPRKIKDSESIDEIDVNLLDNDSYIFVDSSGPKKVKALDLQNKNTRVIVDWEKTFDPENPDPAAIKNKPDIKDQVLDEDRVVAHTIGGYKVGDVIEKGTNIMDIVSKLLFTDIDEIYSFYTYITPLRPSALEDTSNFIEHICTKQILESGFEWYLTLNNDYFVIAINKQSKLKLNAISQPCGDLEFVVDSETLDDFDLYYLDKPATGGYDLVFKFEVNS